MGGKWLYCCFKVCSKLFIASLCTPNLALSRNASLGSKYCSYTLVLTWLQVGIGNTIKRIPQTQRVCTVATYGGSAINRFQITSFNVFMFFSQETWDEEPRSVALRVWGGVILWRSINLFFFIWIVADIFMFII